VDALGGSHAAYGLLGVVAGAAYIFFAYIGFDTVSTHAGEAKNPQKDVPFGIITSLIVCTILYILVALVLTGMVNYKDIDITAPIAAAFGSQGLSYAVFIISIAALAGLTSVLIVMLLGQSRVFFAISKDGLLPKNTFGELHPTFRTPWKANILIGLIVSIVSAFTPIDSISKMVNIGTLLAFVMVCIATCSLADSPAGSYFQSGNDADAGMAELDSPRRLALAGFCYLFPLRKEAQRYGKTARNGEGVVQRKA
jgi:APA family basic amino acid/polyamine antiporter